MVSALVSVVPVAAMARALRPIAGPDQAILIGQRQRMDAARAAFVNAVAINLLDYDDTHLPTIIHPNAPVASAALALAQWRGGSGRDVIHGTRFEYMRVGQGR